MKSLYLIITTLAGTLATLMLGPQAVLTLVLPTAMHRGWRLLLIILVGPPAFIVPVFSQVICLAVLSVAGVTALRGWLR